MIPWMQDLANMNMTLNELSVKLLMLFLVQTVLVIITSFSLNLRQKHFEDYFHNCY